MADCNKQHSLHRRASSQGPSIYLSSQITVPHRRAISQGPQAYSSSQTSAPHQRATKQGPRASSSSQTIAESKRINVLLDYLISCYRGKVGEPWRVFKLTPKEYVSLWSLLEKQSSLYDYVMDKLR